MKERIRVYLIIVGLCFCMTADILLASTPDISSSNPKVREIWRAMVFAPKAPTDAKVDFIPEFKRLVEDALVPNGINVIIFDMHWNNFRFTCRPEFANVVLDKRNEFSKTEARQMAKICKDNQIRVIVGMNFLTHQNHGQLLKAFPKYNWPGAERSWDPLNPHVNAIAFDMADELLDAFQADAFHVGMDEAFDFDVKALAKMYPEAANYSPAELLAKCIRDYHKHLVEEKGVEMLMWTDTLEDRFKEPKGLKDAIDMIPKDIIMCYWYYYVVKTPKNYTYPWPRTFIKKGFRVLACPWNNQAGTDALMGSVLKINDPKMLGVLFTTWSSKVVPELRPALLQDGDPNELDETIRGVAHGMRTTLPKLCEYKQKAGD